MMYTSPQWSPFCQPSDFESFYKKGFSQYASAPKLSGPITFKLSILPQTPGPVSWTSTVHPTLGLASGYYSVDYVWACDACGWANVATTRMITILYNPSPYGIGAGSFESTYFGPPPSCMRCPRCSGLLRWRDTAVYGGPIRKAP